MRKGVIAALAAAALVAGGVMAFSVYQLQALRAAPVEWHATVVPEPPVVGEIALESAAGPRSLSDWRGSTLVVFFGFTNCPDVCPLTMARLAKAYRDLGEPADIQVVMITVDPEHDTPEVLQEYVERFHPSFVGLSGSNAQIARAARTFFIGYRDLPDGNFLHTDTVAVLDTHGRMRFIYGQDRIPGIEEDLPRALALRDW